MESFINSLPKPVVAIGAIFFGILLIFLLSPPHSVCDTQEATMRETQAGNIFGTVEKKKKIPPVVVRTKEACQLGNSPGSCYEYFMVLKKVVDDLSKASSECTAQLFSINEVKSALNDGIELMVRLAWGVKPPEPGFDRFGWMQEAELAIFCRLKGIYIRAEGEDAWGALRNRIATKLPGEEIPPSSDPSQVTAEARKASELLSEQDIWNRSLFSVRCDAF